MEDNTGLLLRIDCLPIGLASGVLGMNSFFKDLKEIIF